MECGVNGVNLKNVQLPVEVELRNEPELAPLQNPCLVGLTALETIQNHKPVVKTHVQVSNICPAMSYSACLSFHVGVLQSLQTDGSNLSEFAEDF